MITRCAELYNPLTKYNDLKAVPIEQNFLLNRYKLIHTSWKEIFNLLVQKLSLDKKEMDFKKAMAGLFMILHEGHTQLRYVSYPNIAHPLLEKKHIQSDEFERENPDIDDGYFSAINKADLLMTSPLTGTSELSDQEIKEKILQSNILKDPGFLIDSDYSIERTDILIKVKSLKEPLNNKTTLPIPTLFFKWNYMDDNLQILRYAGINIEKPSLENLSFTEQRAVVMKTLQRVEEALKEVTKFFLDTALELVQTVTNKNGKTLQEWYEVEYARLETEYMDELSRVI